jgi:hypothetical protein
LLVSFKADRRLLKAMVATFAPLRPHHGEQTLTLALHAKGEIIVVEVTVWAGLLNPLIEWKAL